MRPASRQRTLSGTSRPLSPTVIHPEELKDIFGREIFTQSDYESLLLVPSDLREGQTPMSMYFPRPAQSVRDLAQTFRFPNPVPYVNVPAECLNEPWATEIQEVGWCRIDLLKQESSGHDVSERGAAELAQKGYRLPNMFEMMLIAVILHRRRNPLAQTMFRAVTSDKIVHESFGKQTAFSMVVVMHNNQIRMHPAADAMLKDYPAFHTKIG